MQIQNNQLSFQGAKSNTIRQILRKTNSGLNARKIPETEKWVASGVDVIYGNIQPVPRHIITRARKNPEEFPIGDSKAQAMRNLIKSLIKTF